MFVLPLANDACQLLLVPTSVEATVGAHQLALVGAADLFWLHLAKAVCLVRQQLVTADAYPLGHHVQLPWIRPSPPLVMPRSQGVILVVVVRAAAALTWTADVATCCVQNLVAALTACCAKKTSPESHLEQRPHSWSTRAEDFPLVELVEMVAVLQSSAETFAVLPLSVEASAPPEQVMTPAGVMMPGSRIPAAVALVANQLADSARWVMEPAIAAQS